MRRWAILGTAVVLAAAPAAAQAKTETSTLGVVTATFSYTGSFPDFAGEHLVISRDGTTLFDGTPASELCPADADFPCAPVGSLAGGRSVQVADLDGDGEPEVLLDLFTGGAHCCTQALAYRLAAGGAGYTAADHDFSYAGFSLKDAGGDAKPEFLSADGRFPYRFASYAGSASPVAIFRFGASGFQDVTRTFKRRVRHDAKRWWTFFKQARSSKPNEPRSPFAAWAADEYRLGRVAFADRIMRREARHGHLFGDAPRSAKTFVRRLRRFLTRAGYR